jgi:hypothetical protein
LVAWLGWATGYARLLKKSLLAEMVQTLPLLLPLDRLLAQPLEQKLR